MATLKTIVDEIILEKKQDTLTISYDLDLEISNKEPAEEPAEEPVEEPAETEAPEENVIEKGMLLTEAEKYKQKISGEKSLTKDEASNIQTINDLVAWLAKENHVGEGKQTSVQKVLGKQAETQSKGKIISPIAQEIILILTGSQGNASTIGDLVDKDDKIILEITIGKGKYDNIGFRINKNPGTDIVSTTIVKDGEVLSGTFDAGSVNKQILYYRNSVS